VSKPLRKVVFPVAGLGTRFLPATKVVAKEMLPVLDKPLIQYAVDARNTRVEHIVEKPAPQDAPSNLAVVGRYVLEPEIFDFLRQTQAGVGQEIQLTDAISAMLRHRKVFAHRYIGERYDCGSKEGFFKATIALGRKHHGLIAG
jgi:UTP--glucose-1-phosphate uridylyltransferase